jgi:hypothetical protein
LAEPRSVKKTISYQFFREAGSEKHLKDIQGMLEVHGARIDRGVLNEWVQRQGVEAQWKLLQWRAISWLRLSIPAKTAPALAAFCLPCVLPSRVSLRSLAAARKLTSPVNFRAGRLLNRND